MTRPTDRVGKERRDSLRCLLYAVPRRIIHIHPVLISMTKECAVRHVVIGSCVSL